MDEILLIKMFCLFTYHCFQASTPILTTLVMQSGHKLYHL